MYFPSAFIFCKCYSFFTCIFHISGLVLPKITFGPFCRFQNNYLHFFLSCLSCNFLNPTLIGLRNYISKHKERHKILGQFYISILIFLFLLFYFFLLCRYTFYIFNLQSAITSFIYLKKYLKDFL